jgi:hypothetical protein
LPKTTNQPSKPEIIGGSAKPSISELLDIRITYKNKIEKIHASKTKPQELIPWFKLMNVKVINLMQLINNKYGIDERKLYPFQNQLRLIITEDKGFIEAYSANYYIELTENTKNEIYRFLQDYSHLFNDLIVEVNDA